MHKPKILGKVSAIIASAYVPLIIGTSMFFAVLLVHISKQAMARSDSAVDISKIRLLHEQESPKSNAMRLNAIWMRERS